MTPTWNRAHVQIPQLGFGVYQSPPEVTTKTVTTAVEAGYRHIDSAQWYLWVFTHRAECVELTLQQRARSRRRDQGFICCSS